MGDLICGFIVGVPIGWIFNVIMSVSLIEYDPPNTDHTISPNTDPKNLFR